MAILTKEQYDKRTENAIIRQENNKQVTTLTEEQHELIAEVCNMRHKIHSSDKELYNMESLFSEEASKWIDEINSKLKEVNLSKIENIPRIEDIPTANDVYDGLIDEDEEEDNVEEFFKIMNILNNSIEKWLSNIDFEHGTKYCPTGAHRILF